MRISDRRGIFGRNEVKQKGGKSRGIKAYRLLCPIRSQCCTNYNAPTGALDSKSSRMLLESFNFLNTELSATILMVTHDAFTASYAGRVIFIKDGKIFNEIRRGESTRKEFFDKIIDVVTLLGGDLNNAL